MRGPVRQSGFTLMELIVAVGLVGLVLTLLGAVFNQTQQTMSRGAAMSEMLGATRAISAQFQEDAKRMLLFEDLEQRTGEPAAFLVIVQAEKHNVHFPRAGVQNSPPEVPETIRSDQLVFFRVADGMESMAPGATTRYDSDARAAIARIWYGHVAPDNRSNGAGTLVGTDPGDAEQQAITDLVLGRQALLLVDSNDPTSLPNATGTGTAIFADATTMNLGDPVDLLQTNGAGSDPLWHGYTDVLMTDPATNAIFTYPDSYPRAVSGTPTLYNSSTAIDLSNGEATTFYRRHALSWAFARRNARLIGDPNVASPALLSLDVGQAHAVFVPYVSDFIVEFAADIVDDVSIDPTDGKRTWGTGDGGVPDGEPDMWEYTTTEPVNGSNVSVTRRAVKWYTADAFANEDTDNDGIGNTDPNQPVTWEIPTNYHSGATTYPPQHDGTLPGGATANAEATFVFGHTGDDKVTTGALGDPVEGEGKWWPYLIRIRYRLHNAKGDFSSLDPSTGEPINGRWFEQVIAIPR